MRTAIAHRNTKTLRVAEHDIGSPFPRRGEQSQRSQVTGHRYSDAELFGRGGHRTVIFNRTHTVGVLQHHGKYVVGQVKAVPRLHIDLDTEVVGAHFQNRQGLWVYIRINQNTVCTGLCLLARTVVEEHKHGFSAGGAFVKQRSIGDGHSGEVAHHGLVVQQRFQTALCNLRLVRSVGSVPTRVLQHIALNHRRNHRWVVTQTDVILEHLVLRSNSAEVGEVSPLGHRRGELQG